LIGRDLTVDASVWVAGADVVDAFHHESRRFFSAIPTQGVRLFVPTFAIVEVACALARKLRDPVLARTLTTSMFAGRRVSYVPVDSALISAAMQIGTSTFLRGADTLYAATAQVTGSQLVSRDQELIRRAGAVSPTDWLSSQT
jgi:predicted nucleic acid-binding protein